MKVTASDDLQGRIIKCQMRTELLGGVLTFYQSGEANLSDDALAALGLIAAEMADELKAVEELYIQESNELFDLKARVANEPAGKRKKTDHPAKRKQKKGAAR